MKVRVVTRAERQELLRLEKKDYSYMSFIAIKLKDQDQEVIVRSYNIDRVEKVGERNTAKVVLDPATENHSPATYYINDAEYERLKGILLKEDEDKA